MRANVRILVCAAAAGLSLVGGAILAQPATPRPPATVIVISPEEVDRVIIPHRRPPMIREQAVELKGVGVTVDIEEQVGTTTLELTLHNPAARPQEAQVLLPVPEGATVRSFQYDGVGPEPTATLLRREEARRIYDAIVNRQRDPGLLEFAGYNLIRSSVFPIPAGATQKVRISYEQVHAADGARVDYLLPRSESLGAEGVAWTIQGSIKSKRPIATVYSPSHEIAQERVSAGHVKFRVPEGSASAPGSLRLSYVLAPPAAGDDALAATVLCYPDASVGPGGGYFLLLGAAPAQSPTAARTKREVIVVIDRSGSMRGQKIEQAKAAAAQVLEGLEPGEAFNIVDYSDTISTMAARPLIKTAETMQQARAYIGQLQANGGTALHDALVEALRQPATPEFLPLVLFLTDGLPTVGERNEVRIRDAARDNNSAKRRIFTFGVGFDVNTPLLTGIARTSRAASTFVLPDDNVEVAVSQVYRRLSGPVLSAPRLTALDASGKADPRLVREVMPGVLGDVFDGDQVLVMGQYTGGGPVTLRLEGEQGGKARSYSFTLDPASASARHGYVPRLWAGRKIAALIEAIRQAGAEQPPRTPQNDPGLKELVGEIVALSTRHGILTEYTSFLAVEPGSEAASRPMPALSAAPEAAGRTLETEAQRKRAGQEGVQKELNNQQLMGDVKLAYLNRDRDAGLGQRQYRGVQAANGRSLLFRNNRWTDAQLIEKEAAEPERTIEFGTPEYQAAVDALVREGQQWMLGNAGDLYVMLEGKRTLLKAPKGQ